MKTKQRFFKYVRKTDSCWIWTGAKNDMGYGYFRDGQMTRAHRYSWELHNGKIPDGLHVLHACDNPGCVNPAHLWLGTHQDNMDDRSKKGRCGSRENVARGEAHSKAKLNESQVKKIRAKAKIGIAQDRLAEEYEVSQKNISRIVNRETWKHI